MEQTAIVNNSIHQTSPRPPLHGCLSRFDRRGARAKEHEARPPARFISLLKPLTVNQKQEPQGNTLLAQRYPIPGNPHFWRTATTRPEIKPIEAELNFNLHSAI
jgi:hypothetical protein